MTPLLVHFLRGNPCTLHQPSLSRRHSTTGNHTQKATSSIDAHTKRNCNSEALSITNTLIDKTENEITGDPRTRIKKRVAQTGKQKGDKERAFD